MIDEKVVNATKNTKNGANGTKKAPKKRDLNNSRENNTFESKKRKTVNLIKKSIDLIKPNQTSYFHFHKGKYNEEVASHLQNKLKEQKNKRLVQIHDIKYLDWKTFAINAICVNPSGTLLAIARSDSSIEIRSVDGKIVYKTIPGMREVEGAGRIHCMTWITTQDDNRQADLLVTAGLNGYFVVWNLVTLKQMYTQSSFGGAIWCMRHNSDSSVLALGCEDGTIRLFEIHGQEIRYKSFLKSNNIEVRILSLAWSPDNLTLVAGNNTGSIQVYSMKQEKLRFLIENKRKSATPLYIWALEILKDQTICSGDSQGVTTFWDGITGTFIQSFESHESDILAVTKDKYENLYLAGVDQKITKFSKNKNNGQWVTRANLRYHVNDVNSLCVAGDYIVSGSIDTRLFVCRLDKFDRYKGDSNKIYNLQNKNINYAPLSNFITVVNENTLNIHTISPVESDNFFFSGDQVKANHAPVLQIRASKSENIVCSALSRDAKWLAFSTISSLQIYSLDASSKSLSLNPFEHPSLSSHLTASRMIFGGTDKTSFFAFMQNDMVLHVFYLDSSNYCKFDIASLIEANRDIPFDPCLKNAIVDLTCSYDGKWLACVDVCGNIFIFDLVKSTFYHKIINKDRKSTLISFHPFCSQKKNSVILYIADVSRLLSLTCFNIHKKSEMTECKLQYKSVTGLIFSPSHPNRVYFYAQNDFGYVDPFSKNLKTKNLSKKENLFYSIYNASFYGKGQLLLIKKGWGDILKTLPPGFVKKKYKN